MKIKSISAIVGILAVILAGIYFSAGLFDASKRQVQYYFYTKAGNTAVYEVEFFNNGKRYKITDNTVFVARYGFLDSRRDQQIPFRIYSNDGTSDSRPDTVKPSQQKFSLRDFQISADLATGGDIKTKINGPIGISPIPPQPIFIEVN